MVLTSCHHLLKTASTPDIGLDKHTSYVLQTLGIQAYTYLQATFIYISRIKEESAKRPTETNREEKLIISQAVQGKQITNVPCRQDLHCWAWWQSHDQILARNHVDDDQNDQLKGRKRRPRPKLHPLYPKPAEIHTEITSEDNTHRYDEIY